MSRYQQNVAKYGDVLPLPGTKHGSGHRVSRMVINAGDIAKTVDITIDTVADATAYVFTVAGNAVSYTSSGAANREEIRDGLLAEYAVVQTANGILMTAFASGLNIRLVEDDPSQGEVTVTEADANMTLVLIEAHSNAVAFNPGEPVVMGAENNEGVKPNSATDVFLGVVELRLGDPVDLDLPDGQRDQYPSLNQIPVGSRGGYVVVAESVVSAGDPAFVRFVAGAGGTVIGAWRNDADTASAFQVPNARYRFNTSAVGQRTVVELLSP